MEKHRTSLNGSLRAPDNWKGGIPSEVYLSSLARHFWSVWTSFENKAPFIQDDIWGILFNVMGLAFEVLREETK